MEKIGVVGLGLIGSGIARSLCDKYRVAGVDSDKKAEEYCSENGWIAESGLGSLTDCTAIFVCVPYSSVERTVKQVCIVAGEQTVITDTAAVKNAYGVMPPNFIGGHPFAGTEQSGCKASFDGMFESAFWALTTVKGDERAEILVPVIEAMGAIPVYMTAAEHDEAAGMMSHLPHLAAYALVESTLKSRDNYAELAAGAYLDATQMATSSPDYWLKIAKANRDNVTAAMDSYIDELKKLRDYIASDNGVRIRAYLSDAKLRRDSLMSSRRYRTEYSLYVRICDEVGAVAAVLNVIAELKVSVCNIRIDCSREGEGGLLRLGFRNLDDYTLVVRVLKEQNLL